MDVGVWGRIQRRKKFSGVELRSLVSVSSSHLKPFPSVRLPRLTFHLFHSHHASRYLKINVFDSFFFIFVHVVSSLQ
jgi:hypothetical protein